MEQTTNGAGFLKVTGILMIIGGGLATVFTVIAILGIAALALLSDGGGSAGLLYASGIVTLVSAVAQLIAGIIGVKNCKNPQKADTCIGWGIAVAVLFIVGTILNCVGGGKFSILSFAVGLVVPVLYIFGAFKNKQA